MSAGEHGLTAVLFSDWVASTQLRAELGPDASDALRRAHDEVLARAVERNNGRVVKGQGDGVMATFPSTVDAASAAIAMQQGIGQLARRERRPLEIRVGISAGDVSIEGDDCFGEPVIEASRLCDSAAAGQVLCSDIVPLLSRGRGGHDFRTVGAVALKGFDQPTPASELQWQPASTVAPLPQLIASAHGPVDFVGRHAEIQTLEDTCKAAVATGGVRLALVAGEPGMGKTRLVAEFARGRHAEGAVVLAGRCDEDLGVPYQPFVEGLRHFVAHHPPDEIAVRLGRWGGELARVLPELGDAVPGLEPPVESDPETQRYRLFQAITHWLAAAAGDTGLVLVLDDLHWAAKPTLQLLRHLVRADVEAGAMVIGTYRQTDLDRAHPLATVLAELRKEPSVIRLSLDGLDLEGVRALMEAAAGHDLDEAGLELAAALRRETNGLPLFVQQVLAHLAESGLIVQEDGRWRPNVQVSDVGLPEGVREVIGLRLARLGDDTNALLATAAVIGQEVPHDLLRELCGFDDDRLDRALAEATSPGLLVEQDGGTIGYRFTHALVRATLLDELSTARRVAMHGRTARAIEALHGADDDRWIAALAHHYSEAAPGGEIERALHYRLLAGQRSLAQHADEEAIDHFEAGIALLDDLGHCDDEVRFELLVGRGAAQVRALLATAADCLLEAADLARTLGGDRLIRVALAGDLESLPTELDEPWLAVLDEAIAIADATVEVAPETRSRLLLAKWKRMINVDEVDETELRSLTDEIERDLALVDDPRVIVDTLFWVFDYEPIGVGDRMIRRILEFGPDAADPTVRAKATMIRVRHLIFEGRIDAAREGVGDLVAIVDELSQNFRYLVDALQASLCQLTGDLHGARAHFTQMAERWVHVPGALEVVSQIVGFVHYDTGEMEAIRPFLLTDLDDRRSFRANASANVVGLVEAGEDEAARSLYEAAVDAHLARPPQVGLGTEFGFAEATARLDDTARARLSYDRLLPFADRIGAIGLAYVHGTGHRALGLLATALDEVDLAAEHFAAAEVINDRMGAPILQSRTYLNWAEALLRRGGSADVDEARTLLQRSIELAERHGALGVSRPARALLDRC